jgi:6-phosphofructokinase 1
MKKRCLVLTGGGDCPGLNAVIRAVVKRASKEPDWEIVGSKDSSWLEKFFKTKS